MFAWLFVESLCCPVMDWVRVRECMGIENLWVDGYIMLVLSGELNLIHKFNFVP